VVLCRRSPGPGGATSAIALDAVLDWPFMRRAVECLFDQCVQITSRGEARLSCFRIAIGSAILRLVVVNEVWALRFSTYIALLLCYYFH
jgi:hypothetical protein